MSVSPDALRETMRLWSCGVTIITTAHGQERIGMTASSFTSISVDPPLILVCLHKEAGTTKLIEKAGVFGVSILAEDQADISAQFAGYKELPEGADRFYQINTFQQQTDAPLLSDAIAWLDCKCQTIHDGGTHQIILGEVLATGHKAGQVWPLVYHNRAYRQFVKDEP